MADVLTGADRIAFDVYGIADSPANMQDRAEALLEPLRRMVPFTAHWFGLLDPGSGKFLPITSHGYDEQVSRYMAGPAMVQDIELIGMNRSARAMCVRRLPVPPSELPVWAEYLCPAGFREGAGLGLFTSDGRYLGLLSVHTDTAAHPTDPALNLLEALGPVFARAFDPLRGVAAAARLLAGAHAGAVVTRDGDIEPLPGLHLHPLLRRDSPLLAVAVQQVTRGPSLVMFLWPYPTDDGPGHVRVTVLGLAAEPPHRLSAVVALSEPGDLRGLTGAELDLLGLLVEGWSTDRVAVAFRVTRATVLHRVEQIRCKIGAPDRALTLMRALTTGLFVPSRAVGRG
ncbi:helix-turn-helix transcriptional regulator [Pseudonocardia acidicola]|uniref:Helix-turn-helix transcriptional regulator n=1 Tax=Pseudonocardia acidicola TaxID=2724939 RepID=A0ABX1S8L2_9PSEU|nr:helix-turn-helix transcriptional regulator [Pseudonocardia acidicola]NMH97896.1 helix-turn-helix transcriptional regulator [Pseudonocardia acidicola]